jgi:hypothetical protein
MAGKNTPSNVVSSSVSLVLSLAAVYIVVMLVYRASYLRILGLPGFNMDAMPEEVFTYEPHVFFYTIVAWLIINIGFGMFRSSESWQEMVASALGKNAAMMLRFPIFFIGLYTPYILFLVLHGSFAVFKSSVFLPTSMYLSDLVLYMMDDDFLNSPIPYYFFWLIPILIALVIFLIYIKLRSEPMYLMTPLKFKRRVQFFRILAPWELSITFLVIFYFLPAFLGELSARTMIDLALHTSNITSITSRDCLCGWCGNLGSHREVVSVKQVQDQYIYSFIDHGQDKSKTVYLGKWDDQLLLFQRKPENKGKHESILDQLNNKISPNIDGLHTICVMPNIASIGITFEIPTINEDSN